MDIDQANQVAEYLAYEFDVEVEVYEAYSGRGMYGAEVPAFIVNDGDQAFVSFAFGALGLDPGDMPQRTDNMGQRLIVY